MPRTLDMATRLQFTHDSVNQRKQRCNHCQSSISNQQSAMKRHLVTCSLYHRHQQQQPQQHQQQQQQSQQQQQQQQQSRVPVAIAQPKLTSGQKNNIQKAFAKAIILGGLPANTLDSDLFRQAFQQLNASFRPPTRHSIQTIYVPQLYNEFRLNLRTNIDSSEEIAVFFDISVDELNNSRILRVSFQLIDVDRTCYYWQKVKLGPARSAITNHVAVLKSTLEGLVDGRANLRKIRALYADTPSTLQLIQKLVVDDHDLQHCWAIVCDAHGLQRLVKDVVSIEPWKSTLDKATALITAFGASKRQYARLRDCQRLVYNGKTRVFVLAIMSRWDINFRCCQAVQKNREALIKYTLTDEVRMALTNADENRTLQFVVNTINSHTFWLHLDLLMSILEPVHSAIVSSEAVVSHVGQVIQRWSSIQLAWLRLREQPLRYNEVDFEALLSVHRKRQAEQTATINWVTWSLDFHTITTALDTYTADQIEQWFRRYAPPAKGEEVVSEFNAYRSLQHPFRSDIIQACSSPTDVWTRRKTVGSPLGNLALRAFNTIATSVPSERDFSALSLLLYEKRGCGLQMEPELEDQFFFIHMNNRAINRLGGKTFDTIDESEQEMLEELVFDQMLDTVTNAWSLVLDSLVD